MGFNNAKILKDAQKKAQQEIRNAVVVMGTTALNWFDSSFSKQGFEGDTFDRWQQRKSNRDNEGRSILIKTGRLRRSLRKSSSGAYAVTISSNVPYAKIQNDGGVIHKGQREHILSFDSKNRFTRQRTARQRGNTSHQQKVTIGSHTITIPSRRFVGYSGRLNREIIRMFESKIKSAFP